MSDISNGPPQANPVLSAYESFQSSTPLVTRYMLTTLVVTFIANFFFDLSYAASNIPLFTVHRFEAYRVITSNFICSNLLSLVFAFLSFTDNAKRLEFSMGSTAFLALALTLSALSNCLFLAMFELFYVLTQNQNWLLQSSDGIWIILFGIIAVECANAPPDSKRKLFFFDVPTIYYPCGLLGLFTLFVGLSVSWCLSVAIGYAYGYGYCDRIKFSSATLRRWEDGCLRGFTTRSGWVVGHAASGTEAWTNSATGESYLSNISSSTPSQTSGGAVTQSNKESPLATGFPSSGGRTLGTVSSRSNAADARAARLAALEKAKVNNDREMNDGKV